MVSIEQSIDQLYEVFGKVPRPKAIEGCPCCVERKGVDVLISKSLKKLSPDELSNYAFSVFLTIGCEEDFFYFLPRILEIQATNRGWWPEPECVARSIRDSKFSDWPADRQQAVISYFQAVFHSFPVMHEIGIELGSWICAAAIIGIPIQPFLKYLADNPEQLLEFYEDKFTSGFWDKALEAQRQVVDWLATDEIQKKIMKAYRLE